MRFLSPWALFLLVLPLGLGIFAARREHSLFGRALTLTILIFAISQPELSLRRAQEEVILVVDRSASVGNSGEQAFWELARTIAEREAKLGVVVFAGNPAVVRIPSPGVPRGLETVVSLEQERSDLGAALDLACALLRESGQIVLISDGRDTEGKLWGAVSRIRARGIPIQVFPVGISDAAQILSLRGPSRAPPGEVQFALSISAKREVSATLRVFVNGALMEAHELALLPGIHEELFALHFSDPGVYWLDFSLVVPDDPCPQNNQFSWVLTVGDIPPILVVGEGESAVDSLLIGAGLPFRRVPSFGLENLSSISVVILDDYPLGLLGPNMVEGLRAFLAQGGGLWLIQGRQALTGYAGAVEEILPVTFSVPQAFQEAQVAIVFVLDRSASMAGRAGSVAKIELLKEAAAAAAELVPDQHWLGAIAFDRSPVWLASLAPASQAKPWFFSALAGLTPSGGTDLWPAVELALTALSQVPARVRHIILVSDGKTVREGRNFQVLYDEVKESGVGFTAIAIGPDADLEILSGLAEAGGGQVLALLDPTELRAVLVQETRKALRPRFLQGEFAVIPGPAAGSLARVDFPKLFGYSLTFPKPTGEVALLSSLGDPLLVFGRLGLGQVAVLNTDLRGMWSKDWVNSPVLSETFAEIFSRVWSERQAVEVSWERKASALRITLDVAQGGRWVQGLKFSGTLSSPNKLFSVSFKQTAPGRYETEVPLLSAGVYLLSFSEELGRFGGTAVIPVPYSPEFTEVGADMVTLQTITKLTGGVILEDEELPTLKGERREWVQLWPALLWAGAGSFLLDLGWRKFRRLRGGRV